MGNALSLDVRVSKRTIQKYMKQIRPKRARGQNWKTFLHNHTAGMSGVGACDFLQETDLFFRPLFALFIIALRSRNNYGKRLRMGGPRYLVRDKDRKFGPDFARVASTSSIKVLRTPYRTRPREYYL